MRLSTRFLLGVIASLLVLMVAMDRDHNGIDDRPRVSTDYVRSDG